MELTTAIPSTIVAIITITVMAALLLLLNRGFNHKRGSAKGPMLKKSTIRKEVLKYHLTCGALSIASFRQGYFVLGKGTLTSPDVLTEPTCPHPPTRTLLQPLRKIRTETSTHTVNSLHFILTAPFFYKPDCPSSIGLLFMSSRRVSLRSTALS